MRWMIGVEWMIGVGVMWMSAMENGPGPYVIMGEDGLIGRIPRGPYTGPGGLPSRDQAT